MTRWTKHVAFFTLMAFTLGLLCRDIIYTIFTSKNSIDLADEIDRITGGRSYVDPDFDDCRAKAHPGYISRYPRRQCASNNTYLDFGSTMTPEQAVRVNACVLGYKTDLKRQLELEKKNKVVRWSSHHDLNRSSFVIEVGGYNGSDAEQLNSRYHPGTYVVLEPVAKFFNILKKRFFTFPNVVIYKFGIDVTDGVFYVNEERNDAVSIFEQHQTGKECKIVNVTKFFENMSVRKRDVDLITMNCEGCEYAVLDLLLSTDYIRHFRNIQFQPHNIPRICYPIQRFCWYQELLRKTHKITFQFKYVWESWKRI